MDPNIFLGLCAQIKIFRFLTPDFFPQILRNVACHFCFILRTRPPGRGLNDLHAASNEYECEMLLWIRQTTDTTVLVCWTPGARRRIPSHPPVISLLVFGVSQIRQENRAMLMHSDVVWQLCFRVVPLFYFSLLSDKSRFRPLLGIMCLHLCFCGFICVSSGAV